MSKFRCFMMWFLFSIGVVCAAGCDENDVVSESLATAPAHLTNVVNSTLGFESASRWNNMSDVSTRHTVGNYSGVILTSSNTEVYSIELGNVVPDLAHTPTTIAMDVYVPTGVETGTIQPKVRIPSLNILWSGNGALSIKTLNNLPRKRFTTLYFSIPDEWRDKLLLSYSDLQIKIVVTSPQTGKKINVDNLRFLSIYSDPNGYENCYGEDGISGCSNDAHNNPSGACYEEYQACLSDTSCLTALNCYKASWTEVKWRAAQYACQLASYEAWDQMWHALQCVYCAECPAECVNDAWFYNCPSYTP